MHSSPRKSAAETDSPQDSGNDIMAGVVLKNMEERLLILSGGRDPVTLFAENNVLVVTRHSAPVAQAFLFAVCMLLLSGFLSLGFVAIWIMLKIAVTEASLLALVFCVVLLAACIPGVRVCLWLQGLVFPFRARIDLHRHYYSLRNGVMVARLSLSADATISIVPAYSRGAWGYGCTLKRGRIVCSWPLIPAAVIGTKHEAFVEAESVKQFIENRVPSLRVGLDQWGRAEIKPGVEYIR